MKFTRRHLLHLAAGAVALPAISRGALAQAGYPSRPVRIMVGFAAGGGNDIAARLIGQYLSEKMGQQFFVENRPGAGSNLAAEAVVQAPADGYTLLLVASSAAINATLYEKLGFNFIRDIAPVAGIAGVANVMYVHPSVPAKTVGEFIAYAKANPGKITMASAGAGSSSHLAGEMFKMMAGIDLIHVPYRGNGPGLIDLIGGQVQVMFPTMPGTVEHVKAGKLRALGVTTSRRSDQLPDVPTVGDTVAGYEASQWYGIGAPKATPREIVERLNREINAGMTDPKLLARMADIGGTPLILTPAQFEKLIVDETDKWAKVLKTANIKVE